MIFSRLDNHQFHRRYCLNGTFLESFLNSKHEPEPDIQFARRPGQQRCLILKVYCWLSVSNWI